MGEPINKRTPLVIADEINKIKQQTCRIMLTNAIEIGRLLKEAKALLPHGEWGKWLVESVSYSQRKANKLMQLFEEYGDKMFTSTDEGDNSNSPTWANLTYSQVLLLLGIPEDEREKFILQHDVQNLTTRELSQAIKELNPTIPETEHIQGIPSSNKPGDIKIEYQTVTKNAQPKSTPQIAASQPFATQYQEKCTTCCQTIADTFQELLMALNQLARLDPEGKEKCIKNASKLAEYMVERLKEWPPVVKMYVT